MSNKNLGNILSFDDVEIGILDVTNKATISNLTMDRSFYENGTALEPSLAFINSQSTGLYSTSDGIEFSTNGVKRMEITSSGTVNVGTGELQTSATEGFLSIPSMNGIPISTPAPVTGLIPISYDNINDSLYAYNSGWKNISSNNTYETISSQYISSEKDITFIDAASNFNADVVYTNSQSGGFYDMVFDSSNNMYVVAILETRDINNQGPSSVLYYNLENKTNDTLSLTIDNNNVIAYDLTVAKYDPSGVLIGFTHFPNNSFRHGPSIAIDSSDNIYVLGNYESATNTPLYDITLPINTTSSITLPASNGSQTILIKFNSTGAVQGVSQIGEGYTSPNHVSVDSLGNIYTYMSWDGTAVTPLYNLENPPRVTSPVTVPAIGSGSDGLLIKYNSAGVVQGASPIIGGVEGQPYIFFETSRGRIRIDSSDNVHLFTTYIANPAIYNIEALPGTTSTFNLVNNVSQSAGLIKFNSSGIAQAGSSITPDSGISIHGMFINSVDDIYICGGYTSTAVTNIYDMEDIPGTTIGSTFPIATTSNGFVIKYSSTGAVAKGSDRAVTQATVYDFNSTSFSLFVDSGDNVFVVTKILSTPPGVIPMYNLSNPVNTVSTFNLTDNIAPNKHFIIKYNSAGAIQNISLINAVVGVGNDVFVNSIRGDNSNIYISGTIGFSSTISIYDFETSTGLKKIKEFVTPPLDGFNFNNWFVIKYSPFVGNHKIISDLEITDIGKIKHIVTNTAAVNVDIRDSTDTFNLSTELITKDLTLYWNSTEWR